MYLIKTMNNNEQGKFILVFPSYILCCCGVGGRGMQECNFVAETFDI